VHVSKIVRVDRVCLGFPPDCRAGLLSQATVARNWSGDLWGLEVLSAAQGVAPFPSSSATVVDMSKGKSGKREGTDR
jgi:hypothetical protein